MNPTMIDRNTGHIQTSKFTVTPQMDLRSLQDYCRAGEVEVKVEDMRNGWKAAGIRNLKEGNLYLSLALVFYNNRLKQVSLGVEERPQPVDSWQGWTKEKELAKLAYLERWLEGEIGGERKFPWGEVWCSYDPRAGFASVGTSFLTKPDSLLD